MPDTTGAPWNLPYPEDTDLVRDGAGDIEALAVATATGLSAAGVGIGTNLVAVNLAGSTGFSTTSTSFVDITNVTVTITPSTNTSKILVIGNVPESNNSSAGSANRIQLFRGSTALEQRSVGLQTAAGGAGRGLSALVHLDSPATTSPTTYTIRANVSAGTGTFFGGYLVAIEVAA